MRLHTLLKDRASINILKILSDNESKGKKFTTTYSELKDSLVVPETPFTLPNLELAGLINVEDSGETVLSITEKGKFFVKSFDNLIDAFQNGPKKQKAYKVKYSLTSFEKDILSALYSLLDEDTGPVNFSSLTRKLFPKSKTSSKRTKVSREVKKLEDLNLVTVTKEKNRKLVILTSSGKKVVENQLKKD